MTDTHKPDQSALAQAVSAGAHAASFGFDWPRALDALEKVGEEQGELEVAIETDDGVVEELGDLLFAVCNVARLLGADPDDALQRATKKFEHRFNLVLQHVAATGADPRDLSLEELEAIWITIKRA